MKTSKVNQSVTIATTSILRDQCLKRLLTSIKESPFKGRVIVSDQNGRENAPIYDDFKVDILYLDYDVGLSIAKNRAISKVDTKFVMWLDDDMAFDFQVLANLTERIKNNPSFGWISPNFYEIKVGKFLSHAANWEIRDKTLTRKLVTGHRFREVDQPSSVGLFRRSVFERLRFPELVKIFREHLLFAWEFSQTHWKGGADLSVALTHGGCFSSPQFRKLRGRREHADEMVKKKLGFERIKNRYE